MTSLNPIYHHGSGFTPSFLDRFLRALERW